MYKAPAWHKIGKAVNQTLSKEDMLKKADADYEVILSPVQVEDLRTGKFVTVEDRQARSYNYGITKLGGCKRKISSCP